MLETFQCWINYTTTEINDSEHTSSFGSFRGEAIPWLYYKQKDKIYFKTVFHETPVDFFKRCIGKHLLTPPTISNNGGENNDLTDGKIINGGGENNDIIDGKIPDDLLDNNYDKKKYNIIQELTNLYKIDKNIAENIFNYLDNGLLDKLSFDELYKKSKQFNYNDILAIYKKHTQKDSNIKYNIAIDFINKIRADYAYNIKILLQIKNLAHYGVFGDMQFNIIQKSHNIKLTNKNKRELLKIIKEYFPTCIIYDIMDD